MMHKEICIQEIKHIHFFISTCMCTRVLFGLIPNLTGLTANHLSLKWHCALSKDLVS